MSVTGARPVRAAARYNNTIFRVLLYALPDKFITSHKILSDKQEGGREGTRVLKGCKNKFTRGKYRNYIFPITGNFLLSI